MKIAILGPAYPLRGGIAQYLALLYRKLEKRGHDVRFISFRKQFPNFLFPGKTQMEQSASADKIPAVAIFIPWNPISWLKTFNHIRRFKCDIVVMKWWMPFFGPGYFAVTALLKLFTKVKALYILDNVIPHEKWLLSKFFTRLAFNKIGGFIAQSEKVEREFKRWYPAGARRWLKLAHHPTYEYQEVSAPSMEESRRKLEISESRTILFFGFIRKYKGLMTLLKAFPALMREYDGDIRLVIAGEFYDERKSYDEFIESAGIGDKVTLSADFIPNEEVGYYFGAADAVVLPYLSASQSGIVQIAYGYGKPVISTETGGLPEVVTHGKTGLLCPPDDSEALTETIIKFYQQKDSIPWEKNITEARRRFTWDNLIDAIEEFAEQG
ncbi:glycosyltransferase [bacterium]|nr:glycosyltransferase [FCB group bacterium]MBL7191108.1 glycosyltransferase [bacterium]